MEEETRATLRYFDYENQKDDEVRKKKLDIRQKNLQYSMMGISSYTSEYSIKV